jgi:hypothetical protein
VRDGLRRLADPARAAAMLREALAAVHGRS